MIKLSLSLVIVGVLGFGLNSYFNDKPDNFSAPEKLAQIKNIAPTVAESIEQSLGQIIEEGGITGALEVINLAFAQKDIFLNDCHALSHFTGHYAPAYYQDNFDLLLDHATNFCARGYLHGAEAQIVIDGSDYADRLNRLCDVNRDKNTLNGCFHGAGHAFLGQNLKVQQSLDLCESLDQGNAESLDIKGCFEGVFSELSNLLGGYDGETGRKLAGEPPIKIDVSPLEYCAQFDERYQSMCAYELNGFAIDSNGTAEDAGKIMKDCIDKAQNETISKACLFNVAASFLRHEIEKKGQVSFQPWILEESKEDRLIYLAAVGSELAQHNLAGQAIDTDPFCNSFREQDEIELCKEQVLSYLTLVPLIDK